MSNRLALFLASIFLPAFVYAQNPHSHAAAEPTVEKMQGIVIRGYCPTGEVMVRTGALQTNPAFQAPEHWLPACVQKELTLTLNVGETVDLAETSDHRLKVTTRKDLVLY